MNEQEEMVKLLLNRAKMLNHHCPKCNLPLFEVEGGVVCVRCGGVIVKPEKKVTREDDEHVSEVLNNKLKELLERVKTEQDPEKLIALVKAISELEARL